MLSLYARARWRAQRGGQLVEFSLALALAGVLAVAVVPLMMRGTDQVVANSVASEYTTFHGAVTEFFKWKRSEFTAAMTDGTGADELCKVNVGLDGSGGYVTTSTALHRCAIDTSMLRYLNVLPATVPLNNRYGERWVAIFKLVYDQEVPPKPTGGVEMLIVSARVDGSAPLVPADPRLYEEAQTAAGFVAGQGGVVPEADRATCVASRQAGKYEACGAGFRVNLIDFLEADEVSAFASRLSK